MISLALFVSLAHACPCLVSLAHACPPLDQSRPSLSASLMHAPLPLPPPGRSSTCPTRCSSCWRTCQCPGSRSETCRCSTTSRAPSPSSTRSPGSRSPSTLRSGGERVRARTHVHRVFIVCMWGWEVGVGVGTCIRALLDSLENVTCAI